jgi:hypothetical protein
VAGFPPLTTRGSFIGVEELIVGATAIGASLAPSSGVASTEGDPGFGAPDKDFDQVGVLSVNNLDAPLCWGVQVPVENFANGVTMPVGSPGESEATGQAPEICGSSIQLAGGSAQGN